MNLSTFDYAPYFRDGRLYLPTKTLSMLQRMGLPAEVIQAAQGGLMLDEDRPMLDEISHAMGSLLAVLDPDSAPYQALNTEDVQFMLTGKLAPSV